MFFGDWVWRWRLVDRKSEINSKYDKTQIDALYPHIYAYASMWLFTLRSTEKMPPENHRNQMPIIIFLPFIRNLVNDLKMARHARTMEHSPNNMATGFFFFSALSHFRPYAQMINMVCARYFMYRTPRAPGNNNGAEYRKF